MKEEALQRSVASYLDVLQESLKNFTWFHCPNGIRSTKIQGAKMKAAGMKSGVPDITIIRAKGKVLFIELKKEGGYLSANQKVFHGELERLNIPVHVVKAKTGGEAVAKVSDILEQEGIK